MKKLSAVDALIFGAALILGFTGCDQPSSSSGGGDTPVPAVTYTVTIADGITNGTVSASKTSGIASGETITLTITPGVTDDDDYVLDTLGVKYGEIPVAVTNNAFTMPDGNVTVTASFKKVVYIGTKKPAKAKTVGDIVFSDGSSMPYADFSALDDTAKDEKKLSAIALIFYKGTGLNSGNDTTTNRTLGVGLKHAEKAWCIESANAYSKDIDTIQCKPDDVGSPGAYTFTDSTANDRNGSDNLEQIAAFLKAAEGVTDDTTGDGASERSPAFYFAKNYKETAKNIAGTDYESGWYLPSIAELFQIYACRADQTNGFAVDEASAALGGDQFGTSGYYWSSSQKKSNATDAYLIISSDAEWGNIWKTESNRSVCAIRAFN